jgi:hypothetical protein
MGHEQGPPDAPTPQSAWLRRKLLPLPVWGWLSLAVVLVVIVVATVGHGGGGKSASDSTSQHTAGSVDPEVLGVKFVDPQGTYTIRIPLGWTEFPVTRGETEAWIVDHGASFNANVNVLTQSVPGIDLDGYMARTLDNMLGLQVIDSSRFVGADGSELATIEYQGTLDGADGPLHFFAVIAVSQGQAIVVTLTGEESTFDRLRAAYEPYMKSVQSL